MPTLSRSAYLLRRAPFLLTLAIAALALTTTTFVRTKGQTTQTPGAQQRRPLDPLTADERARAASIAAGDQRTRTLLAAGGRQRLITVELADDKAAEAQRAAAEDPARPQSSGRFAEVIYFRYATNDGVRALVDLAGNRVRAVTQLDARGVPLAFEEVEEAAAIALRDERLRSLLGPSANNYRAVPPDRDNPEDESAQRVEGLRLLTTSRQDPCWQHRCVALLFRRGRAYLTYTDVTVDLTTQTVRVERTGRQ